MDNVTAKELGFRTGLAVKLAGGTDAAVMDRSIRLAMARDAAHVKRSGGSFDAFMLGVVLASKLVPYRSIRGLGGVN